MSHSKLGPWKSTLVIWVLVKKNSLSHNHTSYRNSDGHLWLRCVQTGCWHDSVGRQLRLNRHWGGRGPTHLRQPEEVHRIHSLQQHPRNHPLLRRALLFLSHPCQKNISFYLKNVFKFCINPFAFFWSPSCHIWKWLMRGGGGGVWRKENEQIFVGNLTFKLRWSK